MNDEIKIIKQNDIYMACDVRETEYEGSYQILEKTQDFPDGRTCGVYYTRKAALNDFHKLSSAMMNMKYEENDRKVRFTKPWWVDWEERRYEF